MQSLHSEMTMVYEPLVKSRHRHICFPDFASQNNKLDRTGVPDHGLDHRIADILLVTVVGIFRDRVVYYKDRSSMPAQLPPSMPATVYLYFLIFQTS